MTPGRPSRPSTRLLLSRRVTKSSTAFYRTLRSVPRNAHSPRRSPMLLRLPRADARSCRRRSASTCGRRSSAVPWESLDPGIRTLGFAGFFGLPTAHRPFASDIEERRLPVLLNPSLHTRASGPVVAEWQIRRPGFAARSRRAWGRFRQAAVSSFAFVEAAGPLFLGKLLSDSLGLTRTPTLGEPGASSRSCTRPIIASRSHRTFCARCR